MRLPSVIGWVCSGLRGLTPSPRGSQISFIPACARSVWLEPCSFVPRCWPCGQRYGPPPVSVGSPPRNPTKAIEVSMREGSNVVHCTQRGKGDAILFIHGMPTNSMLWDGVIQQLSSDHRCFAVDLPGMGETPFTSYGHDYLDRMAKQIESLRIQNGVR